MEYCIGVDLGGTQLRAALTDVNGTIYEQIRVPTQAAEGSQAVIGRIIACIDHVRAKLTPNDTLLGVGIGSPGPLNPETGVVLTMPNLPGWEQVPLREIVSQRTGLHTEIGNDANAAALGEWVFGGGKGCRNFVYLTISTGIGSGVIEQGRLVLGYQGAGAELGHMILQPEGRLSWEDLASGTALGRAAAKAMPQWPDSLLHSLASSESVTAAHVAQAAAQGDALAKQLMERESELLGLGLVSTMHLFSPEKVLLGGSVITANPWLLDHARQVVKERAIAQVYREVPIDVAQLGDQVGVLGAVALLLYELDRLPSALVAHS
jgi:glucokinase